MLKSRIFTFDEENLNRDIDEYIKTTGEFPTELQCNGRTYQIWGGIINSPRFVFSDFRDKGYRSEYRGVPIEINNNLDDGTVAIK